MQMAFFVGWKRFEMRQFGTVCVSVAQMGDNLAQRREREELQKKLARFLLLWKSENNFCNERRSDFYEYGKIYQ